MSNLRPLLERNGAFAATGAHAGLAIMPRQQVLLVTCLDRPYVIFDGGVVGADLGFYRVIGFGGDLRSWLRWLR